MGDGPIRLNLGCGHKLLPGYINCDMQGNYSGVKPDVECDLRALPFPDGHADEVMAIHVFEHFYVWEAEAVLAEWTRVLRPGGTIVLEMPSFDKILFCANSPEVRASTQQLATFVWGGLYGDQKHRSEAMQHKWCYTGSQAIQLLREAGFRDAREEDPRFHWPQRDMRVIGVKI